MWSVFSQCVFSYFFDYFCPFVDQFNMPFYIFLPTNLIAKLFIANWALICFNYNINIFYFFGFLILFFLDFNVPTPVLTIMMNIGFINFYYFIIMDSCYMPFYIRSPILANPFLFANRAFRGFDNI